MEKIKQYKSFQELKKDSEKKQVEKSPTQLTFDDEFKEFNRILRESTITNSESIKDWYLRNEVANPRKSFLKFEFEKFKLDCLPEIPGLKSFRNSFKQRKISKIENIDITIISLNDLIISKESVSREKDTEDIIRLRSNI